jgi:hypothetical protein
VKHQYFGDVHDYLKLGLLRALSAGSGLAPGVVWMLTPDDDRGDGSRTAYWGEPSWRAHDPELFDRLSRLAGQPQARGLDLFRRWDLVPGALDFDAPIPELAEPRRRWLAAVLEALADRPLLFFDPDNGFEPESTPFGSRGSTRYLYWDEALAAWNAGHSLLVYQYFPREKHDVVEARLRDEGARRLPNAHITTFRSGAVLFVLLARAAHAEALARGAAEVQARWRGRLASASEAPRHAGRAADLAEVCDALLREGAAAAGARLARAWPFQVTPSAIRTYDELEALRIWRRDGFIDRYSGERLVFPGALRLLSLLLPEEFPYHRAWKLSSTHPAYWQVYPSVDHVVPVERGGGEGPENLVSTSWLRHSAKSHWTLDELGWSIRPGGSLEDWDGLTGWFREATRAQPQWLQHEVVRQWAGWLERASSNE